MAKHTKFNQTWFVNPKFEKWVVEKNQREARCKVCCVDIDLSNMRKAALESHAKSKKHAGNMKDHLQGSSSGECMWLKTKSSKKEDSVSSSSQSSLSEY